MELAFDIDFFRALSLRSLHPSLYSPFWRACKFVLWSFCILDFGRRGEKERLREITFLVFFLDEGVEEEDDERKKEKTQPFPSSDSSQYAPLRGLHSQHGGLRLVFCKHGLRWSDDGRYAESKSKSKWKSKGKKNEWHPNSAAIPTASFLFLEARSPSLAGGILVSFCLSMHR